MKFNWNKDGKVWYMPEKDLNMTAETCGWKRWEYANIRIKMIEEMCDDYEECKIGCDYRNGKMKNLKKYIFVLFFRLPVSHNSALI